MNPAALDPRQLQQLNELLDLALSLPAEQRQPWLDGLSTVPPALQSRLRALLARAATETDGFMRQPAWVAAEGLASGIDQPGDRIGPYRLMAEIGHGGMSTVWLATRDDGDLRRQVALKLPLAGAGPALARRMARERDILATLEHPNIARLYEAGIASNGRPWLAMERVEGQPIDDFCREQDLGVPARLGLLLQVADAVAHAHGRLVVHRDLKPGNILVTAQGDVRLLDFGIAKLLEAEGDEERSLTRAIGRAVTPDYAAPEQMDGRPVTVATDVYSLGVVAYELLCGQPPYRLGPESLADPAQALRRQRITPASAAALPDRGLARELAGDLDTILAKAMKPEPAERYGSIEALAADLRRHLAGLPVLARPDSLRYRGSKFLRRHRGAVLAGALVLAALLAGSAGTLWQARRAEAQAHQAAAERDLARRELRFANGSESFLRYLLSEGGDRPLTTAELLARADERVDTLYASEPGLRARLQLSMGGLYEEVDRFADAERVLRKALAAARADGHELVIAAAECQLGGVRQSLQQLAEAQSLITSGHERLKRQGVVAADADAWVVCHGERATLALRRGQLAEVRANAQAVLSASGQGRPWRWAYQLNARSLLAVADVAEGRIAAAVQHLRNARDEVHRLGLERTTSAIATLGNLPTTLWRAGLLVEADAAFDEGMRLARSAGREPDATQLYNSARLLVDLGRSDEALLRVQQAAALIRQRQDPQSSAFVTLVEAVVRCQLRQHAACASQLDQAERRLLQVRPAGHSVFATVRYWRALSAQAQGQLPLARDRLAEAVDGYTAAGDRSYGIVKALVALVQVELALGQLDAARSAAERAAQEAAPLTQGLPHSELQGLALLAQAQVAHAAGQTDMARTQVQQALAQLHVAAGEVAPSTRQARALALQLDR